MLNIFLAYLSQYVITNTYVMGIVITNAYIIVLTATNNNNESYNVLSNISLQCVIMISLLTLLSGLQRPKKLFPTYTRDEEKILQQPVLIPVQNACMALFISHYFLL